MADRTIQINSFKYGLDTRREALASLPGTLQTAQNCHINSGGEVEKRKAFVADANLFPTNTFGLQDTDTGLMTFGSDASPNASLPSGVVYQRLQPPYTYGGLSMVQVLFSCSFIGKAFVLAQFSNSASYAFYDGTLVGQITDGHVEFTAVGTTETITQIANDLAGIVNRALGPRDLGTLGWKASAGKTALPYGGVANNQDWHVNVGYLETSLVGSVLVMSPLGVHFNPTVKNNNSPLGLVGAKLIDQNYPGIAAVAASVTFTINAGTNGTIDALAAWPTSVSTSTSLFGGPLTISGGTTASIATALAAAINNYTFITGFSAIVASNLTSVTVYAPTSYGVFTGNITINTTGDITTVLGGPAGTGLLLHLTPATVAASIFVPESQPAGTVRANVAASSSGQVAPVTYTWLPISGSSTDPLNGLISASCNGHDFTNINKPTTSITGPNCLFAAYVTRNTTAVATFRCTATDGAQTVHIDFSVSLTVKTG